MDGHCAKHVFEPTEGHCRTCGGEYCRECLVYAYGAKKPPYCVSCALAAAGVRSGAARPQVRSKRELKRELKEHKRAAKVAAKTRPANDAAADLFDVATIPATGSVPPPPPPPPTAEVEDEPVEAAEEETFQFSMNLTSGDPRPVETAR